MKGWWYIVRNSWFVGTGQSTFFGMVCSLLLLAAETGDHGSESLDYVINSSHFGTVDFHELNEVLYDFEISSQPVSEDDISSDLEVVMVSKHGQSYSCSLPELPDDLEEENETLNFTTLPNISALLQPMQKEGCLIKTMGWWTYEYCHGQYVKQYHVEAGRVVGKTVWLGFFEKETQWDQKHMDRVKGILNSLKKNIANGVPVAYHAVYYVNGTECLLTGKPRMATARIYCGIGPDKLLEVHERETCNYTLSIQSSRICSHPLFDVQAATKKPHMLTCSPLLSREDYLEYLQHELHRKEKELLDVGREDDKSELSKGDNSEHQLLKNAVLKSFWTILGRNTDSGLDIGSEEWEESLSGSSQDGHQGNQDLKSQPSHSEKKNSAKSKSEADFESALAAIMANLMGETTQQQQSTEGHQGKTYAIPKSISDNFETDDETGIGSHDESLREQIPTQQTPQSQSSDGTKWESDRDQTVDSAKNEDIDFDYDFDDLEDFDEDFDDEGFDLDDLSLDAWDEETLREMEEEVEDALEEQLAEAGQAAEVKVKIINLPKQLTEEVRDSEGSDSNTMDEAKTLKEATVSLADSFSKLMNDLLRGDEIMSEERQKQRNLEGSYEQTWSNKPKKQSVKPR